MKAQKQLLILLVLLFSKSVFACSCYRLNLDSSFMAADFVAKVKVLKKFENKNDSKFYKANIEILDLYKGKTVKSIYIYGNYKLKGSSGCWIYTEEQEELIIYAALDKEKLPTVYGCSRIKHLNNPNNDEEIAILEVLKSAQVNYANPKLVFNISSFLSLVNVVLDNNYDDNVAFDSFGVFEFTVNKKFKIKKVRVLKGFDKKIDKKIVVKKICYKIQNSCRNKSFCHYTFP